MGFELGRNGGEGDGEGWGAGLETGGIFGETGLRVKVL